MIWLFRSRKEIPMEIYAVGDVTTLRENDKYMADAKVVRLFQNDDGERMVE